MIVRAVDEQGRWMFGKGKADYRTKNDAIGQKCRTKVKSFLGDCFFALADGIDWFTLLGGKNLIGIPVAVSTQLRNISGVTRVLEASATLDENRKQSIVYSVDTVYTTGQPLTDQVSPLL